MHTCCVHALRRAREVHWRRGGWGNPAGKRGVRSEHWTAGGIERRDIELSNASCPKCSLPPIFQNRLLILFIATDSTCSYLSDSTSPSWAVKLCLPPRFCHHHIFQVTHLLLASSGVQLQSPCKPLPYLQPGTSLSDSIPTACWINISAWISLRHLNCKRAN